MPDQEQKQKHEERTGSSSGSGSGSGTKHQDKSADMGRPPHATAQHPADMRISNTTISSNGSNHNAERTCILIKPDGVQRSLIGKTISAFERKGYTLVAMKMLIPCKQQVEYHYREMAKYNFFPSLVQYMLSSPSVVMVWSGKDVIHMGRKIIGPPMPRNAKSGTLRGKYTESIARNALHASAHEQEAQEEILLWFPEGLTSWTSCKRRWVSQEEGCGKNVR